MSTLSGHGGPRLEAQQRYLSYRTTLVAIVSQTSFVLAFMRCFTLVAICCDKGHSIAQLCLCETRRQGGGIAPFGGSADLPEKNRIQCPLFKMGEALHSYYWCWNTSEDPLAWKQYIKNIRQECFSCIRMAATTGAACTCTDMNSPKLGRNPNK